MAATKLFTCSEEKFSIGYDFPPKNMVNNMTIILWFNMPGVHTFSGLLELMSPKIIDMQEFKNLPENTNMAHVSNSQNLIKNSIFKLCLGGKVNS